MKGDPMDLRLDIERRKKYTTHKKDYNQDGGREAGDSPDSSRERSMEKPTECHKRSKYVQLSCICFIFSSVRPPVFVHLCCVLHLDMKDFAFVLPGKVRRKDLAQARPPPRSRKKRICHTARRIPKTKALTGSGLVRWSRREQLREEGQAQDL